MTALILRRRQRAGHLEGADRAATVRTWHGVYDGEIQVDGLSSSIGVTDRRRTGVVTRAGDRPLVRLDPRQTQTPGPGGPVKWAPHCHHGSLIRDAACIRVQLAARPRGRVRIEVTGDWTELELVALTAAFGLLTRRHRRMLPRMAVVGATGHGPIG